MLLTLQQVKTAVEAKIITATSSDPKIFRVFPNTDNAYELNTNDDVVLKVTINFGDIVDGEKGYNGLTRRQCLLAMGVYVLWGVGSTRILSVCELLEDTFRRLELTTASGEEVIFGDPYTSGGYLTETTKYCHIVNAPFWVWVGNE